MALLQRLAVDFPAREVSAMRKYSPQALDRLFHSERGQERFWFGLMVKLGTLLGSTAEVCLYIETSQTPHGLLLFGLTMVRDRQQRNINLEPEFSALAAQVEPWCQPNSRGIGWLGTRIFSSWPVNFSQFADEKTLALVNPEQRAKAIAALCGEMEEFLRAGRVGEALAQPVSAGAP